MNYFEQNEIIISKEQFKIMVDSFYMYMYIVFEMSLTKSKLYCNENKLNYSYTVSTNTYSLDYDITFTKESIINIVNNYINQYGMESYDCSIINNLDGSMGIKLNVTRSKNKQKTKGGIS